MSPHLSKSPNLAAEIQLDPDPDPPPSKSPSPGFLWSSLFADSASTNKPSSSPSYLPDGTPVVVAPPSVILRASSSWAGHLLCRFLGEPPSPAKFFNDLNRVWGKFGDISVRRFSSGIFLVHVPSPSTRRWILQTGLWSSGTVSFVVSEWSVISTLAPPPKLTSATTVITIRDIPPQLWSQEAVATIAGGVATLIPGTRASLSLSSLGTATIRAIVPLGSPLPPSVLVKDSKGDSVLVSLDYGRLPHLCSLCNSYGHQSHRCLLRQSATKPIPPKSNIKQCKNSDPESSLVVNQTPMSHTDAPESTDHIMDLDSTAEEGMVLNCSSDLHSGSAPPLKSEVSHQNVASQKDPEVIERIMDIDSKVDEGMVLKVIDPKLAAVSPSSIGSEPTDPHASPALVQSASSDPTPQLQSQVGLELQNDSLSDNISDKVTALATSSPDNMMSIESSADSIGQSLTHLEDITDPSSPVDDKPEFSFPPPLSCALKTETDSSSSFKSSHNGSQVHLETDTSLPYDKEGSKCKRKFKVDSKALLRCTTANHCFKPMGIVEKRRKKVNNNLVPSDMGVHQGILHMQSDRVNNLQYESNDAYKMLRNESVNHHEEAT